MNRRRVRHPLPHRPRSTSALPPWTSDAAAVEVHPQRVLPVAVERDPHRRPVVGPTLLNRVRVDRLPPPRPASLPRRAARVRAVLPVHDVLARPLEPPDRADEPWQGNPLFNDADAV